VSLVSIILPLYGNSEYINEAIYSVLNQTYKNIELILVVDNNELIINNSQFLFNDNRLKVIRGNNSGISSALNLGIKYSKGKFIARMDSDDISLPMRIERQLEYLINNNLDIVGCNIKTFNDTRYLIPFPELHNSINFFSAWGNPLAHPTVLCLGEILRANLYNEEITASEDYDLWLRLIQKGYIFGNLQEPLLLYRNHIKQGSKNEPTQRSVEISLASQYVDEHFSNLSSELDQIGYGRLNLYSEYQFIVIYQLISKYCKLNNIQLSDYIRILNSIVLRVDNISFEILKIYIILIIIYYEVTGFKIFLYIFFRYAFKIRFTENYIRLLKRYF
jgi:glycosyltransferase involved in cell wall biosynthesis